MPCREYFDMILKKKKRFSTIYRVTMACLGRHKEGDVCILNAALV